MKREYLEDLKTACKGTVAKTNSPYIENEKNNDEVLYLPTWMHLTDTAYTMGYLYDNWIPEHIKDLIVKEVGDSEKAKKIFILFGVFHDFGKQQSIFNSKLMENLSEYSFLQLPLADPNEYGKNSDYHHTKTGAKILDSLGFNRAVTSIVYSHHGNPKDILAGSSFKHIHLNEYDVNIYSNKSSVRLWENSWKEMAEAILKIVDLKKDEISNLSQNVQVLISGYLIVSDWIASNSYYFPLLSQSDPGDVNDYPDRAIKGLHRLGFTEPVRFMDYLFDEEVFKDEFGFRPNALQKTLITSLNNNPDPGIVIVEAEMGGGKTEGAFAAAQILGTKMNAGGVLMGLPTQATSNGLLMRFKNWADQQDPNTIHSFRLVHGMAKLNEGYRSIFRGTANVDQLGFTEENHLISHVWMEGRKQALLSDFVIGTVDQAIMAALKQKHFMLRHVGLAGKVVILDEIHSFDAFTNKYIDRTLSWLGAYRVPVILLSATLPGKRRKQLVEAYLSGREGRKKFKTDEADWNTTQAYPILTMSRGKEVEQVKIDDRPDPKKVMIRSLSDDSLNIDIKRIIDTELEDGCLGIIVNTVKRAQEIGAYLKETLNDHEVLIYHSRFTNEDRIRIENELLKRLGKPQKDETLEQVKERRKKLIVVGTQTLEQSLDIDFDLMITQLSPMESILQRIGRLWRHKMTPRPSNLKNAICYVFGINEAELDKSSESIYSAWILEQTRKYLPEQLNLPMDISPLVQSVYKDVDFSKLSQKEQMDFKKYELEIDEKESRASQYEMNFPSLKISPRSSLYGMLEYALENDMQVSDLGVRDGGESIEVLLVREEDEQYVCSPCQEEKKFDRLNSLSEEEAREIMKNRVKLPPYFSIKGKIEKTIEELEKKSKMYFSAWLLKKTALKGELFLMLNSKNECRLGSKKLVYSRELGLLEKED